jgi:hypothetical protein
MRWGVKEQHQVTVTNKSAALENLEVNGDINTAWITIRQNIKILAKESLSYCESKYHKPWFDEKCTKLVVKESRLNYSGCRKQVK